MNANIVCHQSQTGWKISDILRFLLFHNLQIKNERFLNLYRYIVIINDNLGMLKHGKDKAAEGIG